MALGEKLQARFEKWQAEFDIVGSIQGKGAMLGVELVEGPDRKPSADKVAKLVGYCRDNGLIILHCGTYGHVIRTLIPLVITDEQLDKGLSIMEAGLKELA